MWVKLSEGRVKLDPEREAELYEATWRDLAAAGYDQYEISNFSRPGRACLHNLNTWRMHEWIGIGPSAASQQGGRRGANVADLGRWFEGIGRGERMTEDAVAALGPRALLAEDALIFGLRMNAGGGSGVPARLRWPEAPWSEFESRLARLEGEGLLERRDHRVRLTHRGRLLADAVGAEVMAEA